MRAIRRRTPGPLQPRNVLRRRLPVAILLSLLAATAVAEPLVLSVPPRFTPERATALFAGYMDLVSRSLGREVELTRYDGVLEYLDDLEHGPTGIVFGGPHVLGTLVSRGSAEVLALFEGRQTFVILAPRDDETVFGFADLAGVPVCGGTEPDLFSLRLIDAIGNPAREPLFLPVDDHRRRIRQMLSGECRAAVVRSDRFLDLTSADGAERTRIVYQSLDYPMPGFAASAVLPRQVRERIRQVTLSAAGRRALAELAAEAAVPGAQPVRPDRDALAGFRHLLDMYFAGY